MSGSTAASAVAEGGRKMNWSEQQEAIFDWFASGAGNLVVRARAGTGKTTTIVEGVRRAPPGAVLVAAFNKEIQAELARRLGSGSAEVKTFHSLGFSFVRCARRGVQIDEGRGWDLAQAAVGREAPEDVVSIVKKLASVAKGAAPLAPGPGALRDLAVEHDAVPEEESLPGFWAEAAESDDFWPADDAEYEDWKISKVCEWAHAAMAAARDLSDLRIDFDDMVYLPVALGWTRAWFDLVVIDEAQDLNLAQLILATKACRRGGRIAVVGDDRQAIYGFRGADTGAIDRMKAELRAGELGLTITRRCPKSVVAIARRIVPDFSAADDAPEGLVRSASSGKMLKDVAAGDFILSRKNAPLAGYCLKLLKDGRRARIRGRDFGAGLVSLVRKIAGKRCADLGRFLPKLEAWRLRETKKWAAFKKEKKVEEAADRAECLVALSDGLASVAELIARLEALFDDSQGGECVILSSIHRAKGLEADRVFVLADTLYPGGRDSVEEQNIHYVAVTRAKRELVLVRDPKRAE